MFPCWERSARRLIDFVGNYPEVEHETRRGKDFERLKTDLERSFLECEFSREIHQVREEISHIEEFAEGLRRFMVLKAYFIENRLNEINECLIGLDCL